MSDNNEKIVEGDVVREGRDMTPHEQQCKTYATIVYALQALTFVFGITWLAAIIVNYIKKADVEGTWLESHFRWQIKTFWVGSVGFVIGFLTWIFIIGMVVWGVTFIWVIYRIAKGWMRLYENKEMPM